ncbi:hypothetical protein D3C81_1974240 [compost metagenome]
MSARAGQRVDYSVLGIRNAPPMTSGETLQHGVARNFERWTNMASNNAASFWSSRMWECIHYDGAATASAVKCYFSETISAATLHGISCCTDVSQKVDELSIFDSQRDSI